MNGSAFSRCRNCNFVFPSNIVPCPKCGKSGKDVFVHIIEESITVRDWITTQVKWASERVYYKKNPKQHGIMIGLSIVPSMGIYFLPSEFGLILGIVGGLYVYFFGQWLGSRKK